MARIEPLDLSSIPEFADLDATYRSIYGFVPNGARTMAHRPALLRGFLELRKGVMGPDSGTVPIELKNLIANIASKTSGCRYCQAHSIFGASRTGAEKARLQATWDYRTSDLFTDAERAALDLAVAASSVPNAVSDDVFADARRHWDDGEIVEIMGVVALFGFLNRWNDSLATQLEDASAIVAEDLLGATGWEIGKHS
jgi:uncharacterized peroxidase-related enzyme